MTQHDKEEDEMIQIVIDTNDRLSIARSSQIENDYDGMIGRRTTKNEFIRTLFGVLALIGILSIGLFLSNSNSLTNQANERNLMATQTRLNVGDEFKKGWEAFRMDLEVNEIYDPEPTKKSGEDDEKYQERHEEWKVKQTERGIGYYGHMARTVGELNQHGKDGIEKKKQEKSMWLRLKIFVQIVQKK